MNNPIDYVSIEDLKELGLTIDEIKNAYRPSSGGVYHARGAESQGKTLLGAHFYKRLVDNNIIRPENSYGNLTFKGKYGIGFNTLKGDDLRQLLWDLTHKPLRNIFVFIDEIDSEFPARMFADKEQTEIALRMWHIAKLGNYVFMTSHLGNSTDLIFHLASHYFIFPQSDMNDVFATDSLDFVVADTLALDIEYWTAYGIIKSMLIYDRKELTENMYSETEKIRPSLIKKKIKNNDFIDDIDINSSLEMKGLINPLW